MYLAIAVNGEPSQMPWRIRAHQIINTKAADNPGGSPETILMALGAERLSPPQ